MKYNVNILGVSMKEKLTCSSCSKNWKREITRGRKPTLCPKCSALSIPQSTPVVSAISRNTRAKKVSKSSQPLKTECVASTSSSDGSVRTGDVFAAYHPRHPHAEKLLEETKGGSVWRCTHCKHIVKIFLPVSAPPTHKCTDNGKSKPCERIS